MTTNRENGTRTMSKGRLKARMLEVFRELERKGERLVVTDNGRPVLLILPVTDKRRVDEVFADVRGKVEYLDDIDSTTSEEWEES